MATAVKCTGDGSYTNLGREPLTAVPYALGLRPGTTIESLTDNALNGIAYTEGRAGLGLPSQLYGSLNQAYDAIWDGANLHIRADNFSGSYTLDKEMTLTAVSGTVIIGQP